MGGMAPSRSGAVSLIGAIIALNGDGTIAADEDVHTTMVRVPSVGALVP